MMGRLGIVPLAKVPSGWSHGVLWLRSIEKTFCYVVWCVGLSTMPVWYLKGGEWGTIGTKNKHLIIFGAWQEVRWCVWAGWVVTGSQVSCHGDNWMESCSKWKSCRIQYQSSIFLVNSEKSALVRWYRYVQYHCDTANKDKQVTKNVSASFQSMSRCSFEYANKDASFILIFQYW